MSDIFSKLLKQEARQQEQIKQSVPLDSSATDRAFPSPIDETDPKQQLDPGAAIVSTPISAKLEAFAPSKSEMKTKSEMQASLFASLLAQIRTIGQVKATNAATFRFPPELLEQLEEIEYGLRKTYKIKTTKNALVVAALALLLLEYEEKGTESALYQCLISE